MTVAAVTMVRDEEDIIHATVAHMLDEVDFVIVADNLSTDSTRARLEALVATTGRLTVVDDLDPAYRQSAKMTALARQAHELGADWVVPFDADEVWRSPHGRIADVLAGIGDQWLIVPAPLYDHVATGLDDATLANPIARMPWRRRDPNPLPKVAVRWREDLIIEQGNHGATYEGGGTITDFDTLEVHHYPYRTVDQVINKVRNGAAAYRAAGDTVRADHGAHWRQWGDMLDANGPGAIAELFLTWYYRPDPTVPHRLPNRELVPPLIHDPPL